MSNIQIVANEVKKAIQEGDSFCGGGKIIASGLVDTALKALEELAISAMQIDGDISDLTSCSEVRVWKNAKSDPPTEEGMYQVFYTLSPDSVKKFFGTLFFDGTCWKTPNKFVTDWTFIPDEPKQKGGA